MKFTSYYHWFTLVAALCMIFIMIGCADKTEQSTNPALSTQAKTVATSNAKSEISVKVVPMDVVAPAIYLQLPNLGITFVDFELTNNGNATIKVSVESDLQVFSEKAFDTVEIAPHTMVTVGQTPMLKPGSIPHEITNTMLHYRIVDGSGAVIQEQTLPVKMYADDTMLWAIHEGDDSIDTSIFIGAFVTPHAPEIDELVRMAAAHHPENSMQGYQCSDCSDKQWSEYTQAQVKAVFDALQQDYVITYINSTIAYGNGSDSPQRVLLPSESLHTGSANCIDGTVLYAAALESMDMHPYIVLIPGHAFLCYETKPDEPNSLMALETTMTGSATFEEATEVGEQELEKENTNGNLAAGKSKILSIHALRTRGILPMK
jgi:hypothetical protein